ncbi:hypothetical protein K440DRAFT_645952 [Wilcoxina mikolae CBS 423.85]|nr:hypothetical protein K440DRAFT_645952 [Wilcoxina mikolae CBS 423.85]
MNTSSFLATPVYTIAAGPKRKEFPVHSGLLSTYSETLLELVAGQSKSSKNRTIAWEQWDEATVGRFVQWLYTKEYQVPAPKAAAIRSRRSSGLDTRRPRPTSRLFAEAMASTFAPSPPSTPSPPSSVLSDPASSSATPHRPTSSATPPRPASAPPIPDDVPLDYEEPFLAHAKLYALAQFTDITPLKLQCINRLAALLDEIRWIERCSAAADNFVKLARYVYENTDSMAHREESLRVVVSSFAAFNFERLDCPSMMALMVEGGDFVIDVVRRVMKSMRKPAVATPPSTPPRVVNRQKTLLEAMKQIPVPTPQKAAPTPQKAAPTPQKASTAKLSLGPPLEKKPLGPPVEKKPSVVVTPPAPAPPTMRKKAKSAVEAMKQKSAPGLERKGSIARLSMGPALDKKPSMARLSFAK